MRVIRIRPYSQGGSINYIRTTVLGEWFDQNIFSADSTGVAVMGMDAWFVQLTLLE